MSEYNMVVGPDDITLAFIDYFDFSQVPVKDFHYYRCKVSFPNHVGYEGRQALLEVTDAKVSTTSPPRSRQGASLGVRCRVPGRCEARAGMSVFTSNFKLPYLELPLAPAPA
jgi:hypothetical protein